MSKPSVQLALKWHSDSANFGQYAISITFFHSVHHVATSTLCQVFCCLAKWQWYRIFESYHRSRCWSVSPV